MDINIVRNSSVSTQLNPEGKKRRGNCKSLLLG